MTAAAKKQQAVVLGAGSSKTTKPKTDFGRILQQSTIACRVRHTKVGTRRSLSAEQIGEIAANFQAARDTLSASKRLFDTSNPAYRAVVRVRRAASEAWVAGTVPYPEPGVRLIRRDRVEVFVEQMKGFRDELKLAAADLQEVYEDLRKEAKDALGSLFNPADYPERVDDAFTLEWDFPSYEPPQYLREMHPALYEQEVERVKARFEEAVRMTEEAFAQQLAELVTHLTERLTGELDGGRPKIFRDSAVQNLNGFFAAFRMLDIGSNAALAALVDKAEKVVAGVDPDTLRKNADVRATVAAGLAEIQAAMDSMMVAKPKRAIKLDDDD